MWLRWDRKLINAELWDDFQMQVSRSVADLSFSACQAPRFASMSTRVYTAQNRNVVWYLRVRQERLRMGCEDMCFFFFGRYPSSALNVHAAGSPETLVRHC